MINLFSVEEKKEYNRLCTFESTFPQSVYHKFVFETSLNQRHKWLHPEKKGRFPFITFYDKINSPVYFGSNSVVFNQIK